MAITDNYRGKGLRGGQPSYFMYEPGPGINVGALGALLLQDGQTARGSTTNTDSASEIKGTLGHRRSYDAMDNQIYAMEQELISNAINSGQFTAGNPDLASSDAYKEFVQGKNLINQLKRKQSRNKMAMETTLGSYEKNVNASREKGLNTSYAVKKAGAGFDMFGTGYVPIAYGSVDGIKYELNEYIPGKRKEDGSTNMIRNPEFKGYMTVQEYNDYNFTNMPYNEQGLATNLPMSALYNPGDLSGKMIKALNDSKSQVTASKGLSPTHAFNITGADGEFLQTIDNVDNFQQITDALHGFASAVSDPERAELTAEYTQAIISGDVIDMPTIVTNKAGEESTLFTATNVSALDPITWYSAKNAKLSRSLHEQKSSKNITQLRKKDDKDDKDKEGEGFEKLTDWASILNPAVISKLSGGFNMRNFFVKQQSFAHKGDAIAEDSYAGFPVAEAYIDRNHINTIETSILGKKEKETIFDLPAAVSAFPFGITPEGNVLDFSKDENRSIRIVSMTTKVVLAPKFLKDPKTGKYGSNMALYKDTKDKDAKHPWTDASGAGHMSYKAQSEVYFEVVVVSLDDDFKNRFVPVVDNEKSEGEKFAWETDFIRNVDESNTGNQRYEYGSMSEDFGKGKKLKISVGKRYTTFTMLVPASIFIASQRGAANEFNAKGYENIVTGDIPSQEELIRDYVDRTAVENANR